MMLRRDFLKLSVLAPCASCLAPVMAMGAPGKHGYGAVVPDGKPHRFALSRQQFLLDGHPFQIRSGEMHPVRIPADYWRHRIRMANAMGLNTISLYLMWNALESEPGVFDLKTGRRDFVRFIQLCQQEGMWVYLRPGPYVCAEWDFGGLPPYLLRDPATRVRTRHDPRYMHAVARYMDAIAPAIKPLMVEHGGPVLMVQLENEYASFAHDVGYLEQLRSMWVERGITGPFSISDGLRQIAQQKTYVSGVALGLDGDTDFAAAQVIAGVQPVWVGEGYPGWLTHWGDRDFASKDFEGTLRGLLEEGRSFNMYVVHGGTNFGFGAGANADDDGTHFQPVITSYDYGAPINERGAATPAYYRYRTMIGTKLPDALPEPPATPGAISFAAVEAKPYASLWDNLPAAMPVVRPEAREILFAQDHGMVMYRHQLRGGGQLVIQGVSDYATVFHGGRYLGCLSRVQAETLESLHPITVPRSDTVQPLEILIDSFGHVGYGQAMADRKGIVGAVRLDGHELDHWQAYSLPLDQRSLVRLEPLSDAPSRPGVFFKAIVALDRTGDCYIDVSDWDKGYLWVNGQLLGRYWKVGPQQRLYCPASWLRLGDNELLLFDLHRMSGASLRGCARLKD